MTCAKTIVIATLHAGKRSFLGVNYCHTPQQVCPRLPGEGYEKCHTVCNQVAHAEVDAIMTCLALNGDPANGHMRINYKPCAECVEHMKAWGITWEIVE